ncbi:hypothetical protein ACFOMD_08105 [Sphingoaurantiacus capsulatus]|uniref:Uncharacterized protein n=1 Tax=Sphingoaurantiacus capsulatus TaxID=1771310 RepID=A0ABV7XBA9_9SPHN
MEISRDLKVHGTSSQMDAFIEGLTSLATPPWSRSYEGEENIGTPEFRVFDREVADSLPAASVALYLEPYGLQIVNIVPRDRQNLSRAEYNGILQDFLVQLAQPGADELGLSIVTSLPRTSLAAETTPEVATLLKQFSGAANKTTGSSHPADFKRWAKFLIAVHRCHAAVDTPLLREALKEHGWPNETAEELISEFEFAQDLLQIAAQEGL